MTNCAAVKGALGASVDGERPLGAEAQVHLVGCPDCRAALARLEEQHDELEAALAPARARRRSLEERVVAATRAEASPARAARRLSPLLAAAAAGFVAGAAFFGWPRRAPTEAEGDCVARLAVATGAVEVMPRGETAWLPLATGGAIGRGARVRTSPAVKCSLVAADGSEVRLDAASEIRADSPRSYDLSSGRVFTVVARSAAAERFEVATPEGRVEAVGTALDIESVPAAESAAAHVRLTVVEGVARAGGEPVEAGTVAILEGGSVARRQPAGDLVRATRWVNEILALRGPNDAEFVARVNSMLAEIGRTKMQFLAEADIRALGDHCALPLLRHVQSPESRADVFRRRNAARILADVAPPELAIDLLDLLEDADGEVRAAAARGIARLTGDSFGRGDDYWRGNDTAAGAAEWRESLTAPDSPFAPRLAPR